MKTYISGWEALNLPNANGETADWHPRLYFNDKKPIKMYVYDENMPLKDKGIDFRFVPFLNKKVYVATFARAIADLVYLDETYGLKNCVNDFLNEKEAQELFEYLKIINQSKNVENFMKFELTKLYFKDKQNA